MKIKEYLKLIGATNKKGRIKNQLKTTRKNSQTGSRYDLKYAEVNTVKK